MNSALAGIGMDLGMQVDSNMLGGMDLNAQIQAQMNAISSGMQELDTDNSGMAPGFTAFGNDFDQDVTSILNGPGMNNDISGMNTMGECMNSMGGMNLNLNDDVSALNTMNMMNAPVQSALPQNNMMNNMMNNPSSNNLLLPTGNSNSNLMNNQQQGQQQQQQQQGGQQQQQQQGQQQQSNNSNMGSHVSGMSGMQSGRPSQCHSEACQSDIGSLNKAAKSGNYLLDLIHGAASTRNSVTNGSTHNGSCHNDNNSMGNNQHQQNMVGNNNQQPNQQQQPGQQQMGNMMGQQTLQIPITATNSRNPS